MDFVGGAALAFGLALMSLSSANANVTLTYTGDYFTTFGVPYTPNDKVTGSIALATALGDNLNLESVTPVAFSFNDGVQTLSNTDTAAFQTIFEFSTDSIGVITNWSVDVQEPVPINSTHEFSEIFTDNNASQVADQGIVSLPGRTLAGSIADTPGVWSSPGSTPTVPEPSTVTMIGVAGLLGLGFAFWRRRQGIEIAY
jgi:PEP-CTERM motif